MAESAEIIPYIFYRSVPDALDWLARVFGFAEELRHVNPGGGMHAQMRFGGQRIMLGTSSTVWNLRTPAETGTPTQGVFIYVDDVAAQHARAAAAAANPDALADHGYGLTFTVHDLDGHPWYFTQRSAPEV